MLTESFLSSIAYKRIKDILYVIGPLRVFALWWYFFLLVWWPRHMLDRFLKSHPLTPQNEKVALPLNKTSPNAFLQHIPAHNVGYCYHFEMATVTTKKNSIGCLEWPGIYSQSQNQQGIQSREHNITVLRYLHTALHFNHTTMTTHSCRRSHISGYCRMIAKTEV